MLTTEQMHEAPFLLANNHLTSSLGTEDVRVLLSDLQVLFSREIGKVGTSTYFGGKRV